MNESAFKGLISAQTRIEHIILQAERPGEIGSPEFGFTIFTETSSHHNVKATLSSVLLHARNRHQAPYKRCD